MALGKRVISVAAAANQVLVTGAGGIFNITVRDVTAVAAPGTLTFFDNTAASGPIVAVVRVGADGEFQASWDKGIRFTTGLTVLAAGADFSGMVSIGGTGALKALPFAGVDALLLTGANQVDSILAAETAGAVAEWRVFDALTITGNPWVGYAPAANETVKLSWPQGVANATGVQYDQVAGAVSGAVYVY